MLVHCRRRWSNIGERVFPACLLALLIVYIDFTFYLQHYVGLKQSNLIDLHYIYIIKSA